MLFFPLKSRKSIQIVYECFHVFEFICGFLSLFANFRIYLRILDFICAFQTLFANNHLLEQKPLKHTKKEAPHHKVLPSLVTIVKRRILLQNQRLLYVALQLGLHRNDQIVASK